MCSTLLQSQTFQMLMGLHTVHLLQQQQPIPNFVLQRCLFCATAILHSHFKSSALQYVLLGRLMPLLLPWTFLSDPQQLTLL